MAKLKVELTASEEELVRAARDGDLEGVERWVREGVNVNAASKDFHPPLLALVAAACNTTQLVMHKGKLVPAGQKLWEQKERLLEVVRMLLDAGADPNGVKKESPLHHLARRVPEEVRMPVARLLLERGADPDRVDKLEMSPLMAAALYGSTGFGEFLLNYAVDVNRVGTRGSILDMVEGKITSAREELAKAEDDELRDLETGIQGLQSLLEALKSRGARRMADLAIAEEKPKEEKLHVATDFLKLVHSGEAEWALLAVKAPFEAVSAGYAKLCKTKVQRQGADVQPATDGEDIPPVAAVAKVKGSAWTVILVTIFHVRTGDMKHAGAAAKKLSELFGTRALTYVGTEESELGRCEVFDNGKSVSKGGGRKAIALLHEAGVVLPAFYPAREGGRVWVSIEESSKGMLERVDLVGRE